MPDHSFSMRQTQKMLFKSERALSYLMERKITPDSLATFKIGYYDGDSYSMYYDRILFPVRDQYGNLLTYQGRAIFDYKEHKQPKYWHNTFPNKSRELYGLYETASLAVKNQYMVIAEGPTDVISFYQSGIPAVCALGSAFSAAQLLLILRYVNRVIIAADGDDTGVKMVANISALAQKYDMPYTHVRWGKSGKDASDVYTVHGREKLMKIIHNAKKRLS